MSNFLLEAGNRLQKEMKRLGLDQAAVAENAGVSRRTQYSYESGNTAMNIEYLDALRRLGADVAYILMGDDVPADFPVFQPPALYVVRDPTPGELDDLVRLYREAGTELRAAALRVLGG